MTLEVKTKLTLEDAASAVLHKLKEGFEELSHGEHEAQEGIGVFGVALGTFIGTVVGEGIEKMKEFVESFVDLAAEGQQMDTALGAMISTAQGLDMNEAIEQAAGLGDELDGVAISAGVAGKDVEQAFHRLVELGGAGKTDIAEAKVQIGQMAQLARVLGKDTSSVAAEFAFMGDGILRTRGQLFQVLKTTDTFGGHVKDAAKYWGELTNEQRNAALAKGLGSVTANLAKAPMTFRDAAASFKTMGDVMKDRLGDPLVQALTPKLMELAEHFRAAIPEVERFAKLMSKDVARWVGEAAKAIEDGFTWIHTHQDEIRKAISDGVEKAKAVVEFILAHKEEIAIAFGAKMAAPMLREGGELAKGGVGLAMRGAKGISALGAEGGLGMAAGAGGAAAVAAVSAALIGVGLAAWQAKKLFDETRSMGNGGAAVAQQGALEKIQHEEGPAKYAKWNDEMLQHFTKAKEGFVKGADELGLTEEAAKDFAESVWRMHQDARKFAEPLDSAAAEVDKAARAMRELSAQSANAIDPAVLDEQIGAAAQAQQTAVGVIAQGFTGAMGASNTGAMQYVANLLAKSKDLQAAFLASADLTAEGFNALADMVGDQAKDFAADLKAKGGEKKADEKDKKATPTSGVHMSGGQTFNVKQDFRDQDPDRVAIVFKRDIARLAVAPGSSPQRLPFVGG